MATSLKDRCLLVVHTGHNVRRQTSSTVRGDAQGYFQEFEIGGYRQMFGGGVNYAKRKFTLNNF